MGQPTEELLIEILSKESELSVSSHSTNASSAPEQEDGFSSSSEITSSPLQGGPVMSSVELGKCDGEDSGKQVGVVVGVLKDINEQAQPLVGFLENPSLDPVQARSTVQLDKSQIGQGVVLMFENGDLRKPIIMGILQSYLDSPSAVQTVEKNLANQSINVELDGGRVTLTAQKEIVLKCGKASITLTKAGKVLIRGAYLLSRSSGINRLKGGAVQLN